MEMEFGHIQTHSGNVHATSVGEVHGALWVMVGTGVTKGLHSKEIPHHENMFGE